MVCTLHPLRGKQIFGKCLQDNVRRPLPWQTAFATVHTCPEGVNQRHTGGAGGAGPPAEPHAWSSRAQARILIGMAEVYGSD